MQRLIVSPGGVGRMIVSLQGALVCWILWGVGFAVGQPAPDAPAPGAPAVDLESRGPMRAMVERFTTDRGALRRFYYVDPSPKRWARMGEFYNVWQTKLDEVAFDGLDRPGQVDYILMRGELTHALSELGHQRARAEEAADLLPFAETIADLEQARWLVKPIDAEAAAERIDGIRRSIKQVRQRLEKGLAGRKSATPSAPSSKAAPGSDSAKSDGPGRTPAVDKAVSNHNKPAMETRAREGDNADRTAEEALIVTPTVAKRAAGMVGALRRALQRWYGYYNEYQPGFAWWVGTPYGATDKELESYVKFLREKVAGLKGKDDDPLIGDPIGRAALMDDLAHERIPYTPEQLIAIGWAQFDWCRGQTDRAAAEMGFDDSKAALEHVKTLHVSAGQQDDLVARQAVAAIDFLDKHDLVTIPTLCRELWRVEMISRKRQRVLPFAAYGGQQMDVAYAMQSMEHDKKLMSMRGNNIHFTRIVTPHELIPGHHLQAFMSARYNTHRKVFTTPFYVEGWALHWEMLLWDLDYARGPEDRIGMLFWRMHRAARIIVSLKFHLGQMTPDEMVDFLVDRVGHEREPATSEVRRYIGSEYSPLYQCGYLVGGLQLRSLHRELVGGGRLTERQFHDGVLHCGKMPIEMVRASLTQVPLSRDYSIGWMFAGDVEPVERGGEER